MLSSRFIPLDILNEFGCDLELRMDVLNFDLIDDSISVENEDKSEDTV